MLVILASAKAARREALKLLNGHQEVQAAMPLLKPEEKVELFRLRNSNTAIQTTSVRMGGVASPSR